ncbi:MAG: OmpA family protein [Opitutaceae bacterium]|nr:OmpA family protein [Cytophagales bacterium]
MKRKIYLIKTFITFTFAGLVVAQEIPKENRAIVKKLETQADKSFIFKDYSTAITLFQKIDSLAPGNPNVLCNIGICYLNSRHKAKSLPYFESAKSKGYSANEIYYYLGDAYHYNHEFVKAKANFTLYSNLIALDTASALFSLTTTKRKLEICHNAEEHIENSLSVNIENLGSAINTQYDEYVPIVSADQTTMYFTSRRPSEFNDDLHIDGKPFEDVHCSLKDANGNWTASKLLGSPVNAAEHDACIGITADAKTLFLYKTKKDPSQGNIYASYNQNNSWTEPEKLGGSINSTRGWESSISVSADNKRLYFSSDRPGGYGGFDIWYCDLLPSKEWDEPKNIGSEINTRFDEDCPFIHFDNSTLFFSSNGHNTMGGFDVFSSVQVPNTNFWTKPRNIGYPINSVDDDMYFIYSSDGSKGYMSSSLRANNKGGKDIYVINRPYNSNNLMTLRGKLLNSDNNRPVDAKITVTDLSNNNVLGVFNTKDSSGKYSIQVEKGKNYSMQFEADNMLFVSENVNLNDPQAIFDDKKVFNLKPIKKGNSIVLNNIFFDYNKYDLKKESLPELDKLTEFLINNPKIQIQVNGFTDSIGDDLYNLRLSKKRANEVRSYLIAKGISKSNMKIDGYGEKKPIASNKTSEGQKMNRRTECQIFDIDTLSKDKKRKLASVDTENSDDIILEGIVPDKKAGIMLLPVVTFDYNNGEEINEYSKKQLDQISAAMKRIPNMRLSIHGYNDRIGKELNNKTLYETRVRTVLNYFVEQGFEPSRFTVIPFKGTASRSNKEDKRMVKFALLKY